MSDLVLQEKSPPLVQLGTLTADTPMALVKGATLIADTLAKLILDKKLATPIQGRQYVRVEGWCVLGALLGVIAREESVIEKEDGTYLATVALVRMADEVVVSRASAECGMDEPTWASRPKYARRSMALTRATGKASRLAFSWIMTMAGFEPTPMEEMPTEEAPVLRDRDGTPRYVPSDNDEFANRVPTGKHKGKKWEEVSSDYLNWVVTKAESAPPALMAGAKAEIARRAKVFTAGISESEPPYESEAGARG